MRRLAAACALLLLAIPNVSASEPPNNVTAAWETAGILVDWTASTIPVDPMTVGFEVLRGPLAAALGQAGYTPVGEVPPMLRDFVDSTAAHGQSYAYCVRVIEMSGPGECSTPAIIIDPGACLYVHGTIPIDVTKVGVTGDLHCLWTTDPSIPWPYPYCSPLGFEVSSSMGMPDVRDGCLFPLPPLPPPLPPIW